jgi:hypothetical protein
MNDVPKVVEHLKRLAQNYRDTHLALETRCKEMTSAAVFLAELKQREATLSNRFRLVQQQLLASLEKEELEKMLELSEIFDEIRVINHFALQAVAEANKPADEQVEGA